MTITAPEWTALRVEAWVEEAADTIHRMPPVKVRGYRSFWPEIVHDAIDAYGWEAQPLRRGVPSAGAITRMDQAMRWMLWLDRDDAMLIWARANGTRWKKLEWQFGASRQTLWRAQVHAFYKIAAILNGKMPAPTMTYKKMLQGEKTLQHIGRIVA